MVLWLLSLCLLQGIVKSEKPVFSQRFPYFFEVQENSPKGHLIGYVNASVSNNSLRIFYETTPIANDVIIINDATGALYVNGTIDADIPDVHDIRFSVSAYTIPTEKVSISVFVIINDINDNFPVFQNAPYTANITEDYPIRTYVTKVQATDVDRKGLSELIYNIQGWTKDSFFVIEEFAGTIFTNKRLDYEKNKSHILNISVTDGRPTDPNRHTVYTTVEIFVGDHDDQGAKFDKYNYYASIQEGMHNNTKLIQVYASDLDKGLNAPVTYGILPATNPGGIYRIDKNSGVITVKGEIDRETSGSSFYLTAQAMSTSHEPATTTVVISINDTNDNGPVFSKNHYTASVLENSLVGTKVVQISANDADVGINKVLTYKIKGGNGKFDIDSTGYVLVNGSLDRETQDTFSFEVHAVEALTKERFHAYTNVTIYIQDVNDNSPVFEKSVFETQILEERNPPVFIIQLNATDKDFGQNSLISYSIVPDAENRHKDFTIDPSSGKLYTAQKLDREKTALYSLLVKATDRAAPGQTRETICTVKVTVDDVNDNAPFFTKSKYVTSVNEAANLNTIVFAMEAGDQDEGSNAKLEYQILPGNYSDFFKIDPTSGIIQTAKELDRESIPVFNLQVQVKDGGNKSASVPVVVNILDINDNSPMFTNVDGYNFNVTEGRRGQFVGVVQAIDIDEGDAGRVKYALSNSDWFTIDSTNGTITTLKELDRESIRVHKITVVAEDMARVGSRNSYAQVEVTVLDVNDNPPKFADPGSYSVVTRKDSEVGSFVYRFKATDPDDGENGRISYVLDEKYQGLFSLENETGVLRIKSSLTNQTNSSMTVRITAKDHGIPTLTDSAELLMYFANVVKDAPIIDPPVVKTSVQENARIGTLVYDIDAKYNGKSDEETFKYSIIHGDESKFKIHFETGRITTLRELDRETASKYTLIIMVQLRLQNEANFATVEVTVEDVNDNPPVFPEKILTASVYENQEPNTTVIKVVATDVDEGINSRIAYQLEGSDNFIIDKYSGIVSTTTTLDRENVAGYNMTVTAINEFSPIKLSSSCQLHVRVLDLDDNPPKFEKEIYHATITENAPLKTSVLKVTAYDPDEGTNAYIKYDIQENDCFFMESQSGIVRTSCKIDREKTPSFTLTLIAKGSTSPSMSSTATLSVISIDVDDNHPHFTTKIFRLNPSENLRLGSPVGSLSVSDNDTTVGQVSYQIVSGNDAGQFSLDNITGVILLQKKLDRESKSIYQLEVRAYSLSKDNKVERKRRSINYAELPYDQATVLITVEDVNDNPPVFLKNTYIAAVREDAKFNTYVARIYANDSDIGNYGSLIYEITSGNNEGLFILDRITGQIKVYKSLIGDAGKSLTLTATARDNYGNIPSNQASNVASVRIHVIGDEQTGIILVEASGDYLHDNIPYFESILSNATKSTATIDRISPTSNKNIFQVYFHAIDEKKQEILSKLEIARLILDQNISPQLAKQNITWYSDTKPIAGKSSSKKETNYEIYIGVIASIAILLLITCAFAVWAACFRKNGFSMVPIKDSEATQFKLRMNDQKNGFRTETRSNTLETLSVPYSVDTIKSSKSTNRYIIEPYESNENIEIDGRAENPEIDSQLQESPFYTVEPHEDMSVETQPSYLDSIPIHGNSWAYGETDSTSSQDIDEIVSTKLSNLTESQIKISMVERMPTIVDDTFVSKDSLTTGGPLFTSEKFEETPIMPAVERGTENYEERSSSDGNYAESSEETCDVDGSVTIESSDLTLGRNPETDSSIDILNTNREVSFSPQFDSNTSCEPMKSSTPTSNPFSLMSKRFESTVESQDEMTSIQSTSSQSNLKSEDFSDINQNKESLNSDFNPVSMNPDRCKSAPLKIIKVDKNTTNEDMVTYL